MRQQKAIFYAVLAAIFYALSTPVSKLLLGALMIAFFTGDAFPPVLPALGAMSLGFVAYGLSIFTYIRAQKDLGAAKTGAFYAIAPFIGVLLAFLLVGEQPGAAYFAALAIMIAGTAFAVWDTVAKQ